MKWKKTEKSQAQTIKPEPKVYRDHIDILRRMNAPEDVIKIAEEVAAANGALPALVKT